jgi:hypothetical protein
MAQLADFASPAFAGAVDILGMTSALFFMPFAKAAAQVGTAVVQEVAESVSSASSAFADMLIKQPAEEEDETKVDDAVKEPGDATAMLALIDQIQSGLQAKLQSMGLELDGELTLSIDKNGQVSIAGDSDSAAVLEQLINSDPALQAKMGALKRACKGSGEADQLEAKFRYEGGRVQLQVDEPVADEQAAHEEAFAAVS